METGAPGMVEGTSGPAATRRYGNSSGSAFLFDLMKGAEDRASRTELLLEYGRLAHLLRAEKTSSGIFA
jgi:hypothetical protein